MLLMSSDPATEFISWFNFQHSTPSVSIKFTELDDRCCRVGKGSARTQFDYVTWVIWIGVTHRYDEITDVLGHASAHVLYAARNPDRPTNPNNHHNAEWWRVYREIRDGWQAYIQKTFDTNSSPSKRMIR